MSGIDLKQKPIRESYLALSKYPRFSTVEKIDTCFYETSTEACQAIANEIRQLVESRNAEGKKCVLGLATGSTPVGVYK